MADQLLDQIDFSRYQRWLNRSLGYDCPIKVLGAAGEPVRGCGSDADAELGRLVAQASAAANGGVQRLDIDAKSTLLYRRLAIGACPMRLPSTAGTAASISRRCRGAARCRSQRRNPARRAAPARRRHRRCSPTPALPPHREP